MVTAPIARKNGGSYHPPMQVMSVGYSIPPASMAPAGACTIVSTGYG